MRIGATLAVAGALLTAGCVGPGGRSIPPAPSRPVTAVPRPAANSSRPGSTASRPVRQPVASVPLAPPLTGSPSAPIAMHTAAIHALLVHTRSAKSWAAFSE